MAIGPGNHPLATSVGQALPHPPGCARAQRSSVGYAMDGFQTLDLGLFAVGTFAAAFVTGLAGFAFGIVAAAVWLHFLAPTQAAALIVAFGLIVQGVSVWKLRHAIKWSRLVPFLIGGRSACRLAASYSAGLHRAICVSRSVRSSYCLASTT